MLTCINSFSYFTRNITRINVGRFEFFIQHDQTIWETKGYMRKKNYISSEQVSFFFSFACELFLVWNVQYEERGGWATMSVKQFCKKTVNVSFTLISLSPRRIPAQSAGVPLLTYATSTHVALSFQPPTIVQYQDIFEDKFKVIFHSFTREIVKGIVFCMSNVFVG